MQDYYDILHVNKNYMLKMDETEKNAYIRQCYDEAKKKDIDIPKEIATISRYRWKSLYSTNRKFSSKKKI